MMRSLRKLLIVLSALRSRQLSPHISLFAACFGLWLCASAQELREMQLSEVPEAEQKPVVVLDATEAILVVHSTIPELSFESNLGVIQVDVPNLGLYRVHLHPGTNIVTFKASGYLSLEEHFYIPAKEAKQVKVTPKIWGGMEENRPEVVLKYQLTSPDEVVRGSIDGKVMTLPFKTGSMTLKPTPGKHVVKLICKGRAWEQTFDLKAGDRVSADVIFSAAVTEPVAAPEPGGLYITSEPSGATVYMNQVQQGTTPLTLENVQPGSYEIEATKPLYLSDRKAVQVKPMDYTQLPFRLEPNFGALEINSQPPGAMVYLNNQPLGTTPLKRAQFDAGKHTLKLVKPLYHDLKEEVIEIKSNGQFVKTYTLKPQFGRVIVTSEPSAASVYFDGQPWGTTKIIKDTVLSGTHTIKISRQHYSDIEERLQVADGQEVVKHYILGRNFATISVKCQPADVQVTIEGPTNLKLTPPVNDVKVNPGSYTIRVEADGYVPYEKTLLLPLGASETVEANLVRMTGNLKVSTEPQGAKIYLDGKDQGETPAVLKDIPSGTYKIRLDKPDFDILIDEVTVIYNQTETYKRQLSAQGTEQWKSRRNKARWLSIFVPGAGQWVSGQNWRGFLYEGAIIGCAISAGISVDEHWEAGGRYHDAHSAYISAVNQSEIDHQYSLMQQAVDDMEKYQSRLNLNIAIAAGVYVIQLADAWIWGGGSRPETTASLHDNERKLQPLASWDQGGLKLGLKVNF